ncbi:hypothetical protein [Capnocytophaga felis]|uniref:Anti-sigma factor n=1 Tax=Capnocytophaga felis TaxID=2267611 RepID=A0A5M4B9W5_9FLAO|nr:hypothetical protein [Capnocytophaga felis]GET46092.1 hypothetical protein RCZ01_13940 [Capnocytophaga felis]GET48884.1 hypothetical protein RCZ02_17150 [Capnocytophaga felis]
MKENIFDIYELPDGHEARFLEKMQKRQSEPEKRPEIKRQTLKKIIYWSISVAASVVAVLLWVAQKPVSLENISETAYRSEQYYLPMIQENIKIIKSHTKNEKMVKDALQQLEKMNADYLVIRNKIIKEGQNKQLLYAMVINFDTQLEFSNNIVEMIL